MNMKDGTLSIPSDWLIPFLLLGLRERGSCGYELTRKLAELGFGTPRPREMYRALRRMEKEGKLVSEYDGFDGTQPERRYAITELGEAYLESWANSLARYREEVTLFFRTYAGGSARDGHG